MFAFLFLFSASEVLLAQAYQDNCGFGFGLTYPRFQSTDVSPMNYNIGGVLSIQRNFSENIALDCWEIMITSKGKFRGSYYYNSGAVVQSGVENMHTNIASGNVDLLYYLVPCFAVDPYF